MKMTDAQLASDNICDEKDKFKFKRQEKLEQSALNLAPLPEQVPMIGMACGLYEDCVSCTADTRCGYASIIGEGGIADTVCMRGSTEGPYFYNDTKSGELGSWYYQTCPVARCRDYIDCKQCLEAGCGYCGGRLACFEGSEFGPGGDDKGPSSCPKRFMPTWAFKTVNQGTSRCPLRQMHMTEAAEKEDVALLRAKKIYRQLQKIKTQLDTCHEKLAPMIHGPAKILLGQKCRDLANQYLVLQTELNSAVDAMAKASQGGEAKTYEMGYKEGLTQAERENAKREGYLQGLKDALNKAEKQTGPAGPAGPKGPKGPKGAPGKDGSVKDNSEDDSRKKKEEVEEIKEEIEKDESEKRDKILNAEKKNSTKLLNATAEVKKAEKDEKAAKDAIRKAVSTGSEEERKKAEAALAAANAELNAAEKEAKKDIDVIKGDGETPVVEEEVAELENQLAVEDVEKKDGEDDDLIQDRGVDFNEDDVIPSSDDDVCAEEVIECVPASVGVQPSATFTRSLDVNGKIIDEGRIQSLKLWNDALSEQIKVSFDINKMNPLHSTPPHSTPLHSTPLHSTLIQL
jgi:hypothetical protein